jgi:hypothetical protein
MGSLAICAVEAAANTWESGAGIGTVARPRRVSSALATGKSAMVIVSHGGPEGPTSTVLQPPQLVRSAAQNLTS